LPIKVYRVQFCYCTCSGQGNHYRLNCSLIDPSLTLPFSWVHLLTHTHTTH